mmetsp:Transcript_8648/g.21084  ORF Transcript_8648/g.21084 Transcript_8648/m.21084 type:complete len:309 (+) Transcript_8648:431-1357(+)
MRDYVSADGLGRILRERHPIGIGNDLVGHEHGHAELLRETRQLAQKLGELHLSLGKLPAAAVIGTVQGGGGIDHDQGVPVLRHDGGCHLEQIGLVFAVVGPCVCHIFEGDCGVHPESLGNALEARWTEGAFSINVDGLSLSATFRNSHLTCNTKRMAELRLARTEFSEHLREGSRLDPSLEELVQLRRSGRERHEGLPVLEGVRGGLEIHGNHLLDDVLELDDLRLGEAAHLGQLADGGVGEGFDRVESGIVELLDVVRGHAVFLEEVEGLIGHRELHVLLSLLFAFGFLIVLLLGHGCHGCLFFGWR